MSAATAPGLARVAGPSPSKVVLRRLGVFGQLSAQLGTPSPSGSTCCTPWQAGMQSGSCAFVKPSQSSSPPLAHSSFAGDTSRSQARVGLWQTRCPRRRRRPGRCRRRRPPPGSPRRSGCRSRRPPRCSARPPRVHVGVAVVAVAAGVPPMRRQVAAPHTAKPSPSASGHTGTQSGSSASALPSQSSSVRSRRPRSPAAAAPRRPACPSWQEVCPARRRRHRRSGS
jgi:hypothetical protein